MGVQTRYHSSDTVFEEVLKWRSSTWLFDTQVKGMRDDLRSQTLWKHKWGWHNGGTMWDNLVTEWAQNNDWMIKRSEKSTIENKRKFATFARHKMKFSNSHRKGEGTGKGRKEHG